MKQKYHFTKLFQLWGILLLLGIALSITAIDIFVSYRSFKLNSEKMRADYIDSQKQTVRQEVLKVVQLISHDKEQSVALTKKLLKSRVHEASAIAHNIYEQNKAVKNRAEIRTMIIDALRPVRFNDGNGYYFMTDFDGTGVLFAHRPELENKNLLGIQDSHGKYVIRDMIEIARTSGEGSYQYNWTKPDKKGKYFRKISFFTKIEPFDCLVGAGFYVDDMEEKIKEELLERISRIRFGKEGYVFINRFNGDALVSNGKRYSGSQKLWEVFNKFPEKMKAIFSKEHAAALTSDGDFIYYTFQKLNNINVESPKASFIYGIPDLQWLIGAGFYLDDVEIDITLLQSELTKQIKTKVFFSTLITAAILTFFLFPFRWMTRRLNKDIDLFVSFFNQPISMNKTIDQNSIQFHEFDQMARNINTLFLDKLLTQQKLHREEMALMQTEAKYRNTMDSTLIGVYIIQDFIFQYVNPTLAVMFGYTVEEMEGKISPLDLVVSEQRDFVKKNLIRRATGELKHPYDVKCVRRNGEVFDAMALGAATIHEGKPASVGTLIDITERKAAEEELRKSENRATALLEAIPDLVFRMNRQGEYIDFKADPSELSIQPSESIIGKNSAEILPPDLATLIDTNLKSTLSSGRMHTFEYQLNIPEKGLLDFEARMVKSGDNEITYIVRNITELKKIQAEKAVLEKELNQSKRMESIGLMAGGVAHDLNNILAGIIGYPELILEKLSPEDNVLRPQITAIQESGKRAAAVVDDLLTVARGAASTREIHELDSLIVEYLDSLECAKIQSLHPQVVIKHQLDASGVTISCSQVHIKKCLMNLVTNGVEAIEGSGTVTISTRTHIRNSNVISESDIEPGEYVVLGVQDNGPGIAKEDLEHIFEPFYSKKTMARSGTGLGLTVVWNTVQDHRGRIFVESNDRGTLFQIYFPICHEKNKALHLADTDFPFIGNGEHILIVDDEPVLRDIAAKMLEAIGYTVDSVSSGEAAIEFVKATSVDLLFIDMLMEPGINGYQTYKEILNRNPGQKAVIASGFSESIDVKAALKLGAKGFIKKPYSMEQLGRVIKEAINT